VTRIKAQLVLFTGRNQKNGDFAEYFGSICYPRERVPMWHNENKKRKIFIRNL